VGAVGIGEGGGVVVEGGTGGAVLEAEVVGVAGNADATVLGEVMGSATEKETVSTAECKGRGSKRKDQEPQKI
jgi:hypothetical protein